MNFIQNRITFLNFDETLLKQNLLLEFPKEIIDCFDIPSTQGYCSTNSLKEIQNRLSKRKVNGITFLGNGNYHYISYLLLSEINRPFSLILFDHHTDLMNNDVDDLISCGSWVSKAINDLPMLEKVCIVGANIEEDYFQKEDLPNNVLVINEQEIISSSVLVLLSKIHSFVSGDSIYISVDKDVLDTDNAHTNWDHGSMSLLQLLYFVRELNKTNDILGLDICGELPISPIEIFSSKNILSTKKNEVANRALLDIMNLDFTIKQ